MARRHVAESEARCAQQAEVLREMIADNHPRAAEAARRLLVTLEDTLDLMRERLRREEKRAASGGERSMKTAMDHARRERRMEVAKRAYLERFETNAPVSSYVGHFRLADALMAAVESGTPLTVETLAEWLGDAHFDRWGGP